MANTPANAKAAAVCPLEMHQMLQHLPFSGIRIKLCNRTKPMVFIVLSVCIRCPGRILPVHTLINLTHNPAEIAA